MTARRHLLALLLAALPTLAAAATYTVTSANDSGTNTLRWAIQQANANAGADSIVFNIGGGGGRNIALATALPALTGPASIDATTQPGYAGSPLIQLDGLNAGAGAIGLQLSTSGSSIRGFSVMRFNGVGIRIDGAGGGNTVAYCHIGLNNAGGASGNDGSGVFIAASPNNVIGPGNTISSNGVDGVRIDAAAATGNVVAGNRIGTNPAGTAAIPNGYNGVVITAASNNRIGGTTAADLNVISGNSLNGIGIAAGASGNLIERNHIGVATDGAAPLGNGENGVIILDSPSNKIGGDVAGTFNVLSSNGHHGVQISGDASDNNVVQRGVIGSDLFGTLDRGNGRAGVNVAPTSGGSDIPSGNVIGSGGWGAGGNMISGNGWAGIQIDNANATLIQGNRIGTDVNGTQALPNGSGGIDIYNGWNTVIGSITAGNLISGNAGTGIDIQSEGLLTILGNRIGTTADGSAALSNNGYGIWVQSVYNGAVIGSGDHDAWTCNRACNLISGNTLYGLRLGNTSNGPHAVKGNFIGSNLAGTAARANGSGGVLVQAYAEIGGVGSEGNLISGNTGSGITAVDGWLSLYGNRIGTSADGLAAVGNSGDGVHIGPDRINLELGAAGKGNQLSGNGGDGIQFVENEPAMSASQTVRANAIGIAANGACLGNGRDGIRLNDGSRFIEVGGIAAGEGNRIDCNVGNGITILGNDSGFGFLRNTFNGNGGLAIDIDNDGVTANDPGDGDVWRENFPVLASAANLGSATRVQGALDAAASLNYRIEFFDNATCDPSGHGEGANWLGSANATTDGAGHAGFSVDLPALANGRKVTATATVVSGTEPFIDYSTSEFSACVTVVTPPPAPTAGNNGAICNRQTLQLTASTISGASYAWTGPNAFTSTLQNPAIANATTAASGNYSVTATIGGVTGPAGATTATVNPCQISIADPAAIVEGTGSNSTATFAVSLSHASKTAITLNWASANGSAAAPADYTAGSGTLTIAANATGATITRPVIGDTLDEDNETFHIDLSNPSAGSISDNRGTATITDDDAAPVLSIDAGGCSITEGNTGSIDCGFVLRLSAASSRTVTFDTATTGGTATAGSDFTAHASTARSIAAGTTTLSVTVPVLGDALDEDNETFTLNVTSVVNATPASLSGTGTISDDDAPPTLGIDGAGCSVIEGDTGSVNCAFVLRLSAASGKTVTFNTATANGTATAGSDYTAHAATARNIAAGSTTLTVNVPVLGDTVEEADETFTLNATGVTNASPASLSGTGSILSDDLAELVFFDGFE
ncbi:MAG: hypothetical protein IPG63_17500 [Xanthomonadales bacterium]|nr:hypothetical protein [Xanthomonadales bacterium]